MLFSESVFFIKNDFQGPRIAGPSALKQYFKKKFENVPGCLTPGSDERK